VAPRRSPPVDRRSIVTDYELLDSGHQAKLERFGEWILHRPSPQAFWAPRLGQEDWARAHARYERSSQGGGQWVEPLRAPESWQCQIGPLSLELRRTGFGHVGVFAEQIRFWEWITAAAAKFARQRGRAARVLNLFAYTGGSSLAAAMGGAEVTHLDASRGVVKWASENADRNDLGTGSIRWIVDDALKFLRREERRGSHYDAIILDPPSFGRGPRGEVWKLEEGAAELLDAVVALLQEPAAYLLLSAHTPGLGPIALANLLHSSLGPRLQGLEIERGEMFVAAGEGRLDLPAGTWARAFDSELCA